MPETRDYTHGLSKRPAPVERDGGVGIRVYGIKVIGFKRWMKGIKGELQMYDEPVHHEDIFEIDEKTEIYNAERDFTTLEAWKKCRDVKCFFYQQILPQLPDEEKYNLMSQIRKASISTTANIAEGYGRYHYQEGIQFYRISRGSLYELKDHLISCLDLNYIDKNSYDEGIHLIESAKITLNGYIKFVKQQFLKSKSQP